MSWSTAQSTLRNGDVAPRPASASQEAGSFGSWEDDEGAQGLNRPGIRGEAHAVRALASPTVSFSAGP